MLVDWAGSPDALATAVHFFWVAGTRMQKSWHGLLQSLLFGACRKHPLIVSIISPERWAAAKSRDWKRSTEPWTINELTAGMRALASAEKLPANVCLFIDGLDEYDSDHAELCKVVRDISKSPHIKLCASSRPWDVFEEGFGVHCQGRLDIHEVSQNDIGSFVTDQLRWNSNELVSNKPEKARFVDRVVLKADGVFLWAYFVTQSMRDELAAGRSIAELFQRLEELPSDLDHLFKHMLDGVDSDDQAKMASILQATGHAFEPLHVDLYWYLEKDCEEHGHALKCPIGAASSSQIAKQRDQVNHTIDTKTRGLLRITTMRRVEFVHRTVKDFILSDHMDNHMRDKLSKDYDSFIAIATAFLGLFKRTDQKYPLVAGIVRHGNGMNNGAFISQLNQALLYISEALKADKQAQTLHDRATALLDDYELAVDAMLRSGHVEMRGINSDNCDHKVPFREELLRHDLAPYIRDKLSAQPDYFSIFDESPLFAAWTPMALNSGQSPAPVAAVLDIIVYRAGSPNIISPLVSSSTVDAVSPWVLFARGTMSVFNMLSGPLMFPSLRWNASLNNAVFDTLLSSGTDPNARLVNRFGAHTVFSHFLAISTSAFLGEECFDGYLRTLDAFFRNGASLAVPSSKNVNKTNDAAFGNLARIDPEGSVLSAYCDELRGLGARLATDQGRARFLASVTEKVHASSTRCDDDPPELLIAVSEAFPDNVRIPLMQSIRERRAAADLQSTRKSYRKYRDIALYMSSIQARRDPPRH